MTQYRISTQRPDRPKIFISYRRDDSAYPVQLIYEKLESVFGPDSIFRDMDSIPFGVDFREHLTSAVAESRAVLAVIGDQWLDSTFGEGPKKGKRRLDDPRDFVRIELEAALQQGKVVIPVLVGSGSMPAAEQLPAEISGLAFRNAAELRPGRDFRVQLERLIRSIQQQLESPPPQTPEVWRQPADPAAAVSVSGGEVMKSASGVKQVLLASGEFLMGSPDEDRDAHESEKPQHRVVIGAPFWLGVYPVMQGQYERLTGSNPSHLTHHPRCPVETVSWFDAVAFCNALSRKEGLEPYYAVDEANVSVAGGAGYRLPTEAEWEYACRAGSTTRWSFGDDPKKLGRYGWYKENLGSRIPRVGKKRPNAWGLHEMHGSVWEWCWDWYDARYYEQSTVADPAGPASGKARVVRGGSHNRPKYLRSACRSAIRPTTHDYHVGFRVARSYR